MQSEKVSRCVQLIKFQAVKVKTTTIIIYDTNMLIFGTFHTSAQPLNRRLLAFVLKATKEYIISSNFMYLKTDYDTK